MEAENLRVALCGQMALSMEAEIAALLPGTIKLSRFKKQPDAQTGLGLDAIVSAAFDASFPSMPRLRLIQSPLTGVDQIETNIVPGDVAICNVAGHGNAVAEYVAMTVLASGRRLTEADRQFRAGSWALSSRTDGPKSSEIAGKTAAILGYGNIGRKSAYLLERLGLKVLICSRHGSEQEQSELVFYQWQQIQDAISQADFVIVACALSDQTYNLIDTDAISVMKSNAFLINVARGECVDAEALFKACEARRIRGAAIDVWYEYPGEFDRSPAPSKYPFERLDNVIMTPHVAAWTNETIQRRSQMIAQNLLALQKNDPLDFRIAREPKGISS